MPGQGIAWESSASPPMPPPLLPGVADVAGAVVATTSAATNTVSLMRARHSGQLGGASVPSDLAPLSCVKSMWLVCSV